MSSPEIYQKIKQELQDAGAKVLLPGDEGYEESLKRWSEHCEKKAAIVIHPTSPTTSAATQISLALTHFRTHSIPFCVRGGGHSTSGSSSITGGAVIDLSLLRGVSVSVADKTIRAEGGTIWEDVDVEAAKWGLATVGGTVNHTGVGGLTLGGGYGYLSGSYGLTIDNLLSVEIVLASGKLVTASATENPDLFWAVRGAGQNFGVVVAFTFRGYEQKDVWAGTLIHLPEKLPQIVASINTFSARTNGSQALLWGFSAPPPGNTPVILTQLFHNGSEEDGREFFKDLLALSPIVDTTAMIPYHKLNSLLNHASAYGGRKQFGSGVITKILSSHDRLGESLLLFETIPFQKTLEVPNDATAFSNRGPYYNVATMFKWYDPALDPLIRSYSRTLLNKASASAVRAAEDSGVGIYGNYVDTDVSAEDVYGKNAQKLLELKGKYDPENLFSNGTRLVPRKVVVVN
ncbi:hypothetical protein B0J11DRAFT_549564 [Dendryphion nanum]|uniref:FAD-binding PCMH-type domain-containing protein n=1 Tax=Dendryphion nanum TaxID=256645 RepID=A0A9P9DWG1_9PLEO|nr:hypothetical protein B0J11DRAFT_549564 [Dendryphion nanum]